MFNFQSTVPLRKTGPYAQKETEGMFGKTYELPKVNPNDGSFMPKCAPGPCAEYSYHYDQKGNRQSTCIRFAEPTRVPQKENWFAESPEKNRKSCAYNAQPVGLFSSNRPTYSVYWNDKGAEIKESKFTNNSIIGGKKRNTRRKVLKRRSTRSNRK